MPASEAASSFVSAEDVFYFLIFLVLIFFACFSPDFKYNEIDVLPSVKQFADSSWLPADWYLNLQVGYRNLFNGMLGPIVMAFDFLTAAYVARIILYAFIATSYLYLVRSLGLKLIYATAVLAVFLYQQSLVADEWIVAAVETKTVSYGFVFLAIAFFLREKYRLALASLGLAFSFHVLVGLYATFCIGIALIGTGLWKSCSILLIRNIWIFVLLGINGFLFCYSQLVDVSVEGAQQAWREYVEFRVPHHAMPNAWQGIGHFILVPVLLVAALAGVLWSKHVRVRFLAWHSIGCVLLICIGFMVYSLLDASYLRFYFFRYPDVMLFFGVALAIALSWQNCLDDTSAMSSSNWLGKLSKYKNLLLGFTQVGAVGVSLLAGIYYVAQFEKSLYHYELNLEDRKERHEVARWIQQNTARKDQFLIDPTYGAFYIEAQRPAFVTFKHLPQLSIDIKEWLQRIRLLNSGELIRPGGFSAMAKIQENYLALEQKDIDELVLEYDLRYFLTTSGNTYSYPAVFSNASYVLYALKDYQ